MKIFDTAKRLLHIEKRDGIFVSRPVLNGQEWADWAAKWKIPSPVAPADMHVTVIASTVDVKMKPDTCPMVQCVDDAVFAMFGPAEDVLVVAFDNWRLWDRNWQFQRNGAVSTWPTYRAHMTISYSAGGFDISEDAMADAPEHIILGAEVARPFQPATDNTVDEEDPEGVEDDGDDVTIIVLEIAASAAKNIEVDTLNPLERAAVRDVAAGKAITRGVAKRLAEAAWAPPELKALAGAQSPGKPAEKRVVEKNVTMTVGPMPADVAKGLKARDCFKADEELQIVYGWASVATVNGEDVVDLQGDTITVKAQREWLHSLMRGSRAGAFEHDGEFCNEVVEGLVLDHALQKSLGIDLGMEGLIVGTYVPDPDNWAKVKDGDWQYSIAGTVLVEEDG